MKIYTLRREGLYLGRKTDPYGVLYDVKSKLDPQLKYGFVSTVPDFYFCHWNNDGMEFTQKMYSGSEIVCFELKEIT